MRHYFILLFYLSTLIASAQNFSQNIIQKSKVFPAEDSITSLARLSSEFYNFYKGAKTTYQRLDSILYYAKNPYTQQFNISQKHQFIYDINGNIVNESSFTWDTITNSYIKLFDRHYSNNGNTILTTDYTINKYKKITALSYNTSGNLILSETQNWNYNTNQWVDTIRLTYNYNANNLINSITKTLYITATNQFINEYKDIYTYNTNNKLILFEHKSYNYTIQQWQNFNKKEYTLNSFGDKISEVCSEWYPNWELLCKVDYTYDNQRNVNLAFIYFWLTNYWDPDQKVEYIYDNQNNMIEHRHGGFNTNGQFVYYDRSRQTYDLSTNSSQLILPPYLIGQSNNKLTERDGDVYNGNSWNQTNKYLYYYSNTNITAIKSIEQVKLDIFPNPTQDYLYIKTSQKKEFYNSTYEIFNNKGQKLLSGEDIYQPIDIRDLSPGSYLIKITNENKTIISKRFVVVL